MLELVQLVDEMPTALSLEYLITPTAAAPRVIKSLYVEGSYQFHQRHCITAH